MSSFPLLLLCASGSPLFCLLSYLSLHKKRAIEGGRLNMSGKGLVTALKKWVKVSPRPKMLPFQVENPKTFDALVIFVQEYHLGPYLHLC